MIHLTVRTYFEPPIRYESAAEHTFDSSVGSWRARFYDPAEWHMGAEGWQLSLTSGWSVTWRHRHIRGLGPGKGFHLPSQYHPWCSALPIIALHAWDDILHLYDADKQRCIERPIAIPHAIQWAPAGEMLAVTFEGRITVLNARGDGFDVPVRHPRYELPDICWWPDGTRFFAVGRLSPDSKTRLSFFAANDGALLESVDFDPVDLMPYNHDAYREVPRDTFSLRFASGVRSVGTLLDTWSRLEFDPAAQLMRAVVCRPAGPYQEINGEWTCPAEERGVEILIRA